jgi:hypothetical protein
MEKPKMTKVPGLGWGEESRKVDWRVGRDKQFARKELTAAAEYL